MADIWEQWKSQGPEKGDDALPVSHLPAVLRAEWSDTMDASRSSHLEVSEGVSRTSFLSANGDHERAPGSSRHEGAKSASSSSIRKKEGKGGPADRTTSRDIVKKSALKEKKRAADKGLEASKREWKEFTEDSEGHRLWQLPEFEEAKLDNVLETRLDSLQDILGFRAKEFKDLVLKDRAKDRERLMAREGMVYQRYVEAEKGRQNATAQLLKLEERLKNIDVEITDLKERIRSEETAKQVAIEKLRKREGEIRALKDQNAQMLEKIRVEENARQNAVELMKRSDEEAKVLSRDLSQLQAQNRELQEELMVAAQSRNAKDAEILTLKRKTSDHIEELKKKENEMRVLKRNHHLSMPSEIRKTIEKIRELETDKGRLTSKLTKAEEALRSKSNEVRSLALSNAELKVQLKSYSSRAERAETELEKTKSALKNEVRRKENELKRANEQSRAVRNKLQEEESVKYSLDLQKKTKEEEVHYLRRRVMDLMCQLHSLEEAKTQAEEEARVAKGHSAVCEEKLNLMNIVHTNDLTAISSTSLLEDDVDRIFRPFSSTSMVLGSSSPLVSLDKRPMTSMSYSLHSKRGKHREPRGRERDVARKNETSTILSPQSLPAVTPQQSLTGDRKADSDIMEQSYVSSPPPVFETSPSDVLQSRLQHVEACLEVEIKNKQKAEEQCRELAEQMLELEKEKALLISRGASVQGGDLSPTSEKGRLWKISKLRGLETENAQLYSKAQTLEMDKQTLELKLSERDELLREEKRKVAELKRKVDRLIESLEQCKGG